MNSLIHRVVRNLTPKLNGSIIISKTSIPIYWNLSRSITNATLTNQSNGSNKFSHMGISALGLVGGSSAAACTFCSTSVDSNSLEDSTSTSSSIVLYQYEPCPYCCKVKAVLDYLKVPYKVVEVSPLSKNELKFTDYKKVPVVMINDEQVIESSQIISKVRDSLMENRIKSLEPDLSNIQLNPQSDKEEQEWKEWIDKKFIILMPPNIYRNVSESLQSFEYVLTEGKFGFFERHMTKYVGAAAMYFITKRLKKRYDIEDERQALYDAINYWLNAIGDQPFHGGDHPNLTDLSIFGVLRSVYGLNTFNDVVKETNIQPWFQRMTEIVGKSSRISISN